MSNVDMGRMAKGSRRKRQIRMLNQVKKIEHLTGYFYLDAFDIQASNIFLLYLLKYFQIFL